MSGTVADLERPEPSPADRYLDLMATVLTRYGLGDNLKPIVGRTTGRRRLWSTATRLLALRRIVVLRNPEAGSEIRATGGDWPVHAETMIGLERLNNLRYCIETAIADGIPGDVIETGVWRGGSAIFMRAVLVARGESHRHVWVADSFQGLPKPRAEHPADRDDLHWTQPYLAVSQADVQANFQKYGLLDDQVHFLVGWFADTLPTAPISQLAVLRVDGDMYGSTMDVLGALYDRVPVGGFVIVDDYGAVPACKQAVDDFRRARDITEPIASVDWTGVYWRRER